MARPQIHLQLAPMRGYVRVTRGADVDDNQWLQVRAEWSRDSRGAAHVVDVPVEEFISRLSSFVSRCRRCGLDASYTDDILAFVQRAHTTRATLMQNLTGRGGPIPADLAETLEGEGFTRGLRDFQRDDVATLIALQHGANFSVPGAGKTTVALAVYAAERARGRVERMLVIAPLSAFPAWFEEVEDCFARPPEIERYVGGAVRAGVEVLIVNYQRLAANYDELADWVAARPTLVLLDEAHRMKRGWRGEWGTACLNLAYLAERRDILTGTPAPQSPRDLVALIDFVWPNSAARILPADALSASPPPDAGLRVANTIRPIFVRTTKKDLGLPPVSFSPLRVRMSNLQRDIYTALCDQYAGALGVSRRERVDFVRMGRIVMYLLEAATNPLLLTAGSLAGADPEEFRHPPLEIPPGSPLAAILREYNQYDTPTKFITLAELVKTNAEAGRKTLVWTNFVRNILTLERMLRVYQPSVIHGGVPPYAERPDVRSRELEIARFRRDPDCLVLIANPAAMSEGISLHHDCHDAIYVDRTFNAGHYLQSIDRIHRLGLDPNAETRITFLLSDGTIDGVVDTRVAAKARLLGDMLDDPNLVAVALPDDEDYGDVIDTAADVEALFAHLRGERADA